MSKVSFSPVELFLLWERNCTRKVVRFTQFMLFGACFFPSIRLCLYWKIEIPCDSSYSVVYFHIHILLPVKPQDARVLVRAKSYKSQRKNEEPWSVQVMIVPYCFVWARTNPTKNVLSFLLDVHFLKFALVYWTAKQLNKTINVIEWKYKKAHTHCKSEKKNTF